MAASRDVPRLERLAGLQADATCIGVDLAHGERAAPGASRHATLLGTILGRARRGRASSRAIAALLGQCMWLAHLNRPSFSAFHRVYDFMRTADDMMPSCPEKSSTSWSSSLASPPCSPCCDAHLVFLALAAGAADIFGRPIP